MLHFIDLDLTDFETRKPIDANLESMNELLVILETSLAYSQRFKDFIKESILKLFWKIAWIKFETFLEDINNCWKMS